MVRQPQRVEARAPRRARRVLDDRVAPQRRLARDASSRTAAAPARSASARLRARPEQCQSGGHGPPAARARCGYLSVLECVPNVSEGRDRAGARRARAPACGASLLDVHADADHHRSVFTLAGPGVGDAAPRSGRLPARWPSTLDLRDARRRAPAPRRARRRAVRRARRGRRPRTRRRPRATSRDWVVRRARACRCSSTTTPTPRGARCPTPGATRSRDARPDLGPAAPHPAFGAVAVGARPPLVAVNCELDTDDVAARPRDRPRRCASATAGCPACARSGFMLESAAVARRCR